MLGSDSTRRLIRTTGAVIVLGLLLTAAPAKGEPKRVDAGPFIDPSLPDCGLQKAIDSVPEGGILVIPRGTYLLRCRLVLKGNRTLSGVGDKTVLTVAPLPPCALLTAPAEKGATSVRVADASRFRPGMEVAVRDRVHVGWWTSHAIITRITDNVLELDRPLDRDYQPARQAYVGHLFPALYATDRVGRGTAGSRFCEIESALPGLDRRARLGRSSS